MWYGVALTLPTLDSLFAIGDLGIHCYRSAPSQLFTHWGCLSHKLVARSASAGNLFINQIQNFQIYPPTIDTLVTGMAWPDRISSDSNSGRLISRCHSALFLMSFIRSRRTQRWAESTWNSWKCKYIRNSYSQRIINLSSNIISCILILLQNCFWSHHNCPSTFIYLIRYIIQLIAAKC